MKETADMRSRYELLDEIERLTAELNDHKTMLSAHKLRERQLVEENAKHGLRYKMLQDKWAKENQGR